MRQVPNPLVMKRIPIEDQQPSGIPGFGGVLGDALRR